MSNSGSSGPLVVFIVCRFFFLNSFIQTYIFLSRITLKYNTVLIQIRPDTLLGQIWIQTVVKGYLQDETLAGNE